MFLSFSKTQPGALAPHPVSGKAGAVCPITGLSAEAGEARAQDRKAALAALEADPDIQAERAQHEDADSEESSSEGEETEEHPEFATLAPVVPVNVVRGSHRPSRYTQDLVRAVGGLPTLQKFTARFYERAFADPHLDQFIRKHEDAHGLRFANWIAEKFGEGTPWTEERRTRAVDIMEIDGHRVRVAHDRSTAHYAAWNSPKRPIEVRGDHFKPHDARVWMRIHFWAARETGLFEPEHAAFMDYYIRFIAHFISVYSSKAPPFTRESARWSASQQNIDRYLANGNVMSDVIGTPLQAALEDLPSEERLYTGSSHPNPSWPYA